MRVARGAVAITVTLLLAMCQPAPPCDPGAGGGALLAPATTASGDEPGSDSPAAQSGTRPLGAGDPSKQTTAAAAPGNARPSELPTAATPTTDVDPSNADAHPSNADVDPGNADAHPGSADDDSESAGQEPKQPIGTISDWLAAYGAADTPESKQPPQLGVLADLPELPRAALVYVRSGQLIRVDFPSGDEVLLTQGPFASFSPKWTDNGRQLFFQSNRLDGIDRVWRIDHDGSRPRRITNALQRNAGWTISNDGRRVAYVRTIEGDTVNTELRVVDVATGSDKVVHRGFHVSYPQFSRDGARLFFVQGWLAAPGPDVEDPKRLGVLELDSGETALFPNGGYAEITSPWDLGDGRLMFVASQDYSMAGLAPRMFTMPAGGGAWTPLSDFVVPAGYLRPLPSPDKQKLALAWSQRQGGFGASWWADISLLSLDAPAARARRLTSDFPRPFYSASAPSWAPDSRHLAMTLTLCPYAGCEPSMKSIVLMDTDSPKSKLVFVGYGSAPAFAPVFPPSPPSIPQKP